MGILALSLCLGFMGCGKEKDQQLSGSYHTEANACKRGIDLTVTDPDGFQMMCPVKQTIVMRELQDLGIEEITEELDEQGMPTSIDEFNLDVIPAGCTDCAEMLILAAQYALAQ